MNARLICALSLAMSVACHAENVGQTTGENDPSASPTLLDKWNELMRQAIEHTAPKKDYGKPRQVKRGAIPEIVFNGATITIDGKPVKMGGSLDEWKDALPGTSRCQGGKNKITYCVWDELGIEMGTSREQQSTVKFVNIILNKEPFIEGITSADLGPKKVFSGYLELDGYGIDANTKFWEIRESADPKRNLRCGLEDCSHPHGRFDGQSSLYLRLQGGSEKNSIYEFSVASYE